MSCRNLSPHLGLRTPKLPDTKRTTFSPRLSPLRSVQAALHLWRAAIGIPFNLPHRAQRSSTRRGAGRYRALGRKRSGNDMALIQAKYRTSSRSAETLLTNCLGLPGSDQNAPLSWCNGTGHLMGSLRPVSFKLKLRCSAFIG